MGLPLIVVLCIVLFVLLSTVVVISRVVILVSFLKGLEI